MLRYWHIILDVHLTSATQGDWIAEEVVNNQWL